MGYVEGKCPGCGGTVRERCNAWVYGSPIRTCPHCQKEFLDNRWREVAIDGFVPGSKNARFYLWGMIGFLAATVVCILWLWRMVSTQGHYPIKLVGCIVVGIAGTIGCAVVFLRIVTGYEDKQNARYMDESRKRLQDTDYVDKLISFGYTVPDEYRKE
ncbi:MAG: hypothetical protein NC300_00570 [Bacteroidales bacterium]|nr:hypothetical protein [Clostridium sp.]MCM1202617.1 hypothetical protein [Bacteroidales bacterium]